MRSLLATVRTAFTDALAQRSAFWTQVGAMILNDVAWVAFWLIFFHRVGHLRGWDSHRILLLFSILTTSAGLVLGLLSNSRRIGQMAADGELDAVLALPVPTLGHLLVRKIDTVNLGDFAFGVVLFAAVGARSPGQVGIYLCGVSASVLLLTGFLVLVGSVAFYAGTAEVGDLGLHAILLLSSYPANVFAGAAKALLYTAVPAAFVAAVPSHLLVSFSLTEAGGLLLAAVAFAGAGWLAFSIGLRRYTSGSAWTRA
ncbi:MAG TPA: ABC-2 family transporter protein [Acidimicrobiales bacterium]|nr:ABC-2 family transporter protein [Acidimicrobiales bacterium]